MSRRCPALCCPAALQRNVEKIESNVAKLEEKLAYERNKHAEYEVVLKEHEAK